MRTLLTTIGAVITMFIAFMIWTALDAFWADYALVVWGLVLLVAAVSLTLSLIGERNGR